MEFFIPGLSLFVITLFVCYFTVPKITPLIAAILSIVFLCAGVYEHYTLFASEYRLSTWQDGLKVYAPAVMIIVIILFIIISIFTFFTSGAVPVPMMPEMASTNDLKNTIKNSLNINSYKNDKNEINDAKNERNEAKNERNEAKNKKNGENGIRKSFLETI